MEKFSKFLESFYQSNQNARQIKYILNFEFFVVFFRTFQFNLNAHLLAHQSQNNTNTMRLLNSKSLDLTFLRFFYFFFATNSNTHTKTHTNFIRVRTFQVFVSFCLLRFIIFFPIALSFHLENKIIWKINFISFSFDLLKKLFIFSLNRDCEISSSIFIWIGLVVVSILIIRFVGKCFTFLLCCL